MQITHVVRGRRSAREHTASDPPLPRARRARAACRACPADPRPRQGPPLEAPRRDGRDPRNRELGYLPEAMVNYLAALGWSSGRSGGVQAGRADREVHARLPSARPRECSIPKKPRVGELPAPEGEAGPGARAAARPVSRARRPGRCRRTARGSSALSRRCASARRRSSSWPSSAGSRSSTRRRHGGVRC